METKNKLVEAIVKGIQEKKGQDITIADLLADEINLFFDELIRKFFRGDADHVFGSFI